MNITPLRVVFDTMVFLQAMANRLGPAKACWDHVEKQTFTLIACPASLVELADVVQRPKVARKLAITQIEADAFLRAIHHYADLASDPLVVFPFSRDPKDEPILNLAISARANYLVTRDLDLLDLTRTDRDDAKAFIATYPSLKIVTPTDFLGIIEADANTSPRSNLS